MPPSIIATEPTTKDVSYEPIVAPSLEKETLSSLAATVQSSVEIITRYLKEHNLPEPSFANLHSPTLPFVPELQKAKKCLIEATAALEALTQFHKIDYLVKPNYAYSETIGLRVVGYDYDVPNAMKNGEVLHISEICKRVNCEDVPRMLVCMRICTQSFIFKEVKPEYFTHTMYSVAYRDKAFQDYCGLASNECFHGAGAHAEVMKKYPNTTNPAEFAFAIAHRTELPYFQWLGANEEALRRFGMGMQGISRDSGNVIAKVYPWKELGETSMVDVGGGHGHISLAIHNANPALKITVQDLPEVIAKVSADFPADKLASNGGVFTLEAHDAFTPQPRYAETYFLRHILHDHPDEHAVKIIANLVPQMKPWNPSRPRSEGSRILVAEMIIQPGANRPPTDRKAIYLNLTMSVLLNARERTYEETVALFKKADKRFRTKFWDVSGPQGTEIVEAWLEDEE